MALAAKQREYVAMLAADLACFIHIVPNPGKALKIFLDICPGFLAIDPELRSEAKCRNAVDDAEIDRLGSPADVGRHVLDRHAEHLGRSHCVNIDAILERLAQ